MKKLTLIFFLIFSSYTFSQIEEVPKYYKLYPTDNLYVFLKLNTKLGYIWLDQWSIEDETRFSNILNWKSLVDIDDLTIDEIENLPAGRFELYPTQNIYNFMLLDVTDGRTWQVQWSLDSDNWAVIEID